MFKGKFKKNRSEHAELLCVAFLFLILTVVALFLVMAGSNNYKKIKMQTDRTFNDSALLSYITNKINGGDNGHVLVETYKGKSLLVLEDSEKNYKTFIYQKDNKVYEILVSYETSFNNTLEGEYMFDVKDIEFVQIKEHLIYIKIVSEEEEKSVYVALEAVA